MDAHSSFSEDVQTNQPNQPNQKTIVTPANKERPKTPELCWVKPSLDVRIS